MNTTWAVAFLVGAIATGVTAGGHDGAEGRQKDESTEVTFDVIVDEFICGIDKPIRRVIRDEASWARLWSEIYRPVKPTPERPTVDFSRDMLIAVSMGTRRSGGFDIRVERIAVTDEKLEVTVHTEGPPPGAMVSMTLTQPVEVVRLERHGQKVVFVDTAATPTPAR